MANSKTADPLLKSNQEYVKLRNSAPPGEAATPRETPAQQAPGKSGYDMPTLERWTTNEIRDHASQLGLTNAAERDRDALCEWLNDHYGRHHRSA